MNAAASLDIALIDAGGANLGSVRYALERLGVSPRVVCDGGELAGAERILLPGVGAAGHGMACLHAQGFVAPLRAATVPVLGICLGMQLLYESSEEDEVECLGLLPGRIKRMTSAPGLRVPHMGWNTLSMRQPHALTAGVDDGAHAYFVHGFAADVDDCTIASSTHAQPFAAVVSRRSVSGVQFHPERSATAGLRILANFIGVPMPESATLRVAMEATS